MAKGGPFLLLPILTRYLGPEKFGLLSADLAYISILAVFLTWSFDAAIVRYSFFYGTRSAGVMLNIARCHVLLLYLVLVLFAIVFASSHLGLIASVALGYALVKLNYSFLQGGKKSFRFFVLQIIDSAAAAIATIVLIVIFDGDNLDRLLAILLGLGGSLFFFGINSARAKNRKLGVSYLTRYCFLISFGTPLLVGSLSSVVKSQVDKIFLLDYIGASELGLYSAGYQLASVMSVIVIAASRTVENWCYQVIKEQGDYLSFFDTIVQRAGLVLLSLIFFLSLCPPSFYIFILGSEFAGVKWHFVIFFAGFSILLLNILYVFVLIYFGKTKHIAISNGISLLVYAASLVYFSLYSPSMVACAFLDANICLLVFTRLSCHYYRKSKV